VARIRTVKPEFFTSEDIVGLTPLARLLYIATWCEADKEGRMAWKPKTLKMRYLPADACDIDALCAELLGAKLVVLYGDGLAYIPKFGQHQHINPRESISQLPDPHASPTRKARVTHAPVTDTCATVTHREEGKGREGKEECRVDDATEAPPPVAAIPLVDGSEFEVPPSKAAEWSAAFPAVDVPQRLRAMRQWCIANPAKKKTRRGVESFVVRWLSNDQDSGKPGSRQPADVFEGAM
jgi:hypothetical protein